MDKTNVRLNLRSFIYWICISLIFFILPIVLVTNLNPFYYSRFENYGVYEEFSQRLIDPKTVNTKLSEVISYLQLTQRDVDTNFFSYEDRRHLEDVRVIIVTLYTTLLLTLGIVLIRLKEVINHLRTLSRFSVYYLITIIPLLIVINKYFSSFFEIAHRIVFTNEYWLLDPKTSNLIKMFPQNIFYEIFLIIFILNILLHVIFIFIVIGKNEKFNRK